MARSFNGSSQALSTTATLDLRAHSRLTVAFWLKWTTFANDDKQAVESSADAFNVAVPGAIWLAPNASGNAEFGASITTGDAGPAQWYLNAARPSAGAWHHYCFQFNRLSGGNQIAAIYVDGISKGDNASGSGATTAGGFGNYTWYFMAKANATPFSAGSIAEIALWPGLLLAPMDVESLVAGIPASAVRPDRLAYYWPLDGQSLCNEAPLREGASTLAPTAAPPLLAGPSQVVRPYPSPWYLTAFVPAAASDPAFPNITTMLGMP